MAISQLAGGWVAIKMWMANLISLQRILGFVEHVSPSNCYKNLTHSFDIFFFVFISSYFYSCLHFCDHTSL